MRLFSLFVGLAAVSADAITGTNDDWFKCIDPTTHIPDCSCMYDACKADGQNPDVDYGCTCRQWGGYHGGDRAA